MLVGEVARVLLGGRAGRPSRHRRCRWSSPPSSPASGVRRRSTVVPVAVDVVEVAAAVLGAALVSTAACRSVRPTGAAKPPSGSCQGRPAGPDAGAGEAVGVGQGGDVGRRRGGRATARRRATYSGCTVSRAASSKPHAAVTVAQPLQRGPGPLGVHVVGGERGDAAPVVDAGARAARGTPAEVDQVRRRLHARLRAEHEPGDGDRGAVLVQPEVVGCAASRCPAWPGSSARSPPAPRRSGGRWRAARRSSRPARRASRRCRPAARW